MMYSETLESTWLSDTDVDELCQGILTNKEIKYADKIDDLSIVENILRDDTIHQMDSSLLMLNPDLSFENRLEQNLNLANKNKIIQLQESKIEKLDQLIEGLMGQIQRYKFQKQGRNHEKWQSECLMTKLKEENKSLTSRCRIYKAAVIKLSGNKLKQTKTTQN